MSLTITCKEFPK